MSHFDPEAAAKTGESQEQLIRPTVLWFIGSRFLFYLEEASVVELTESLDNRRDQALQAGQVRSPLPLETFFSATSCQSFLFCFGTHANAFQIEFVAIYPETQPDP